MNVAVVPARNEADRISQVLDHLAKLSLDAIIVVVNGCQDRTLEMVRMSGVPRLKVLFFAEPLGIDVPRAVGACYSRELGAQAVLFVDGDMIGAPSEKLAELLAAIPQGCDMALTNCYPGWTQRYAFANTILTIRHNLNKEVGLLARLGPASPAHGPHAVSGRLLATINPQEMAVPPVALVRAVQASLTIAIGTNIPHLQLASSIRSANHAQMMGDTLIGDNLEALCLWRGEQRQRQMDGKYYLGYHPFRRWDILESVLAGHWPPGTKTDGRVAGNYR